MKKLTDFLEDRIAIGKITNHHGMSGEVKFFPFAEKDYVYDIEDVLLYNPDTKRFFFTKILGVRPLNKNLIIQIQGIESIVDADKLKGFVVYIEKELLPELKDDEYYLYELKDYKVFNQNDEFIGLVVNVIQTGANDVLVVHKKINAYEHEEILIPMIKKFIQKLDKENNTIKVLELEWFEDESEDKD